MKTISVWMLIALTVTCSHAEDQDKAHIPQADNPSGPSDGHHCLFIGHSFFIPVAKQFGKLAPTYSIKEHQQQTVFSGGSSGSPGALWNGPKRMEIEKILATGSIDLLGMTYFNGENSNAQAYQHWIDLAIKHNPKTRFFIGLSWPKGGGDRSLADFTAGNKTSLQALSVTVAGLRKRYPDNTFIFLNYGPAAVELKALFEAGKLPDISKLKHKQQGLFKDDIGHASRILTHLSALLWLSAIYDVDHTTTTATSPFTIDLSALAATLSQRQQAKQK